MASVPVFDTYRAGAPLPQTLGRLISILLPNIMVAAGVVLFLLIIVFGFGVLKSAGATGDAQAAAKARSALTWSIVGFLLVVSSFFILEIVGIILGVNFRDPVF